MADERLAPTVGIVACLALVLAILVPYLVVPANEQQALGTYYGSSLVGPPLIALLGLVGVIVYAAGRQGRTDPETAAGAGLALGAFAALFSLLWALTANTSILLNTSVSWLPYHRWVVVVVAVVLPVVGAWYARELSLF